MSRICANCVGKRPTICRTACSQQNPLEILHIHMTQQHSQESSKSEIEHQESFPLTATFAESFIKVYMATVLTFLVMPTLI